MCSLREGLKYSLNEREGKEKKKERGKGEETKKEEQSEGRKGGRK